MANTVKARVEKALELAKGYEQKAWEEYQDADELGFDKDTIDNEWNAKFEIRMIFENILSGDMDFVETLIATTGWFKSDPYSLAEDETK